MSYKTKRSKACDVPQKVKQAVWERDNGQCIICHSPVAAPNAHYISRANGGLGIEENIVTLCTGFGNGCHYKYDSGTKVQREYLKQQIRDYLCSCYVDWDESKLVYKKWNYL